MPESAGPLPIAVFLSGGGRTVLNMLDRIEAGSLPARIVAAVADRACAGVERLAARGLEVELVPWERGDTAASYAARAWPVVERAGARLVCLCGFLRLLEIPPPWAGRVMNIHPGLLPEFGGKGMYGARVHRAVLAAGVRESGCTVHFSDNVYDHGPIILRRRVPVEPGDDADSLAARVFLAECEAYPEAITLFATGRLRILGSEVEIE